jgi:hypothetical protein
VPVIYDLRHSAITNSTDLLLHLERRLEWRFARDEKAYSRAISSVVLLIRSAMQLSRDERNGRRKQRTIGNSNQSAACAFVRCADCE